MKLGFIGLGIMGKPMSRNLIKVGHELIVWDVNDCSVEELVKAGAAAAESAADAASRCPVVITMLPDSPQVREAALGKNGIAEGARPGSLLIDMSSIDPIESKAIGAELAGAGIDMLDAPVSGGEPKAVDGTLSVMVGGKRETFDQYRELLSSMAASVVYVGALGSGNVAKLANQIIVANNIAAVAESMALAKKCGVDPKLVFEAIKGGLAGSTVMNSKMPMILGRNFTPGFRIELHIKDLNNALRAGHAVSAPLPLTGAVMEMMQALKADGYEKDDHSALARYYEKLSNIIIES